MQRRTTLLIAAGVAALLAVVLRALLASPPAATSGGPDRAEPVAAETQQEEAQASDAVLGAPASASTDAGDRRVEGAVLSNAGLATITGTCTPESVRRVRFVHESGTKGFVEVRDGRYAIEVSAAGQYWLTCSATGRQSERAHLDVQLGQAYAHDFALADLRLRDVVVRGVDTATFRWPANHRVIAVNGDLRLGLSIAGMRGGNRNRYGFSRLKLDPKPTEHADGAKIGRIEINDPSPSTVAVCAESRVVWIESAASSGSAPVIIDWQEVTPRAQALELQVRWSGDTIGVHSTLFTESGRIMRGQLRMGGADFLGIAPGRYLLQIYGGDVGLFLREIVLEDKALLIRIPERKPTACTLTFVDAKTSDTLAFDPEAFEDDWSHFVELIPVDNGQPVTGYMDTSAMRHSGPGGEGTTVFHLAEGMYRARLRSPEWGSPFVLVDARGSDIEVKIPCSMWTQVTIQPGAERDWRGKRLTLSGADGNLLSQTVLSEPGPVRLRTQPGWTEVCLRSLDDSLVARKSFDSSSGAMTIELD